MSARPQLAERRSHPRYRMGNPTLVYFSNFSGNFGTLENISWAGMGLRMLSLKPERPGPLKLSLHVQHDAPLRLENLWCRLVYDFNDPVPGKELHLKSCGVKFLRLTREQKRLLERLMKYHSLRD